MNKELNVEILALVILLLVLIFILIKSADLIEDAFVLIARKIGISEFLIGFVILGIASALPELSIAINSSNQAPELSLGNLLGAKLIILTLLIGIAAVKFNGISFSGHFRPKDVFGGLLVIAMTIIFITDRDLSTVEGLFLIMLYVSYIIHIFSIYRVDQQKIVIEDKYISAEKVFKLLARSVVGVVLILLTSHFIVETAVELGETANINKALIGLIILAVGTNLIELAIIFRAKSIEGIKLAIGTAFGTSTALAAVTGFLAVTSGGINLQKSPETFESLIPVLVTLTMAILYFAIFSFTSKAITKAEGLMLIGVYASFIITEGIILGSNT